MKKRDMKQPPIAPYHVDLKYKPVYDIATGFLCRIFALIFLVFSIPLILIVAMCIKIEDRGPIFYTQARLGKNNKAFKIYKLRSMKMTTTDGPIETKMNDHRITRVGRFIRLTRIDEIPQLYNIIAGDMRLIGPRPYATELAQDCCRVIPAFKNRTVIQPGLTGWAQVNGGNDLTISEKLKLDIDYINNRGFLLDTLIIFKTVGTIFSGDGAR